MPMNVIQPKNKTSPLLNVSSCAVSRGDKLIVSPVSFQLFAGQCLRVRGKNGSGKTTLLEAISGLRHYDGSIHFSPDVSATYVGHSNGLDAALTGRENLYYWFSLNSKDKTQFTALLDQSRSALNIGSWLDRDTEVLSAGQRRKLALARLKLTNNQIWILDEPLNALDSAAREMFETLLNAHINNGGACIISTHQEFESVQIDVDVAL